MNSSSIICPNCGTNNLVNRPLARSMSISCHSCDDKIDIDQEANTECVVTNLQGLKEIIKIKEETISPTEKEIKRYRQMVIIGSVVCGTWGGVSLLSSLVGVYKTPYIVLEHTLHIIITTAILASSYYLYKNSIIAAVILFFLACLNFTALAILGISNYLQTFLMIITTQSVWAVYMCAKK